jgi:hypothetical protein
MMFIMRHIEIVHEKPEHVRRQIAFGIAIGLTAIIALFWLSLSLATGVFAVENTYSFGEGLAVEEQAPEPEGVVGAAAAILGVSSEPAHIEIVDTSVHSTLDAKKIEETIIPF